MSDLDYIDSYFRKELSPADSSRFEQRIKEEPRFAEEVAFYCNAMQLVKENITEDKKKRFREIYDANRNKNVGKRRLVFINHWAKIAAAAVLLIALAGIWIWKIQPTQIQLADKYIKDNFSQMHVTMGNNDSLQTAAELYNSGKWKESLAVLERLVIADSLHTTIIKDAGIVSLQLKEYDKALNYFERLENNAELTINPGKFYHALVLLKRNQPGDGENANTLLKIVSDQNMAEAANARELLKQQ